MEQIHFTKRFHQTINTMLKTIVPALSLFLLIGCSTQEFETDICIYGGTSAGVISAYSAQQLEKTVTLIEPSSHLGGLSSGGLGATDIGNKYAVTGIARDFYRKPGVHYEKLEMWTFEPHMAETLFNDYVAKEKIRVIKNYRLKKAIIEDTRIREIVLESTGSPFWKPRIKIRAAMAASMAIDSNCTMQEIDVRALQNNLETDALLDDRPASL